MSNAHTRILKHLMENGPTSGKRLMAVGGKGFASRISEINGHTKFLKIIHENKKYRIRYDGVIRLSHKELYPQLYDANGRFIKADSK